MRSSFGTVIDCKAARRKTNVQKRVTAEIRRCFAAGRVPWRNTIKADPNCGMPMNIRTKRIYRGVNPLLLWNAVQAFELQSCWWATREEWNSLGCSIKPGAHGIPIVDYSCFADVIVFNLDEVNGSDEYRPRITEVTPPQQADYSAVEAAIAATGADIRIGVGDERNDASKTLYIVPQPWEAWPNHTKGDYILMPDASLSSHHASWMVSHAHELCHWAEVRTGWMAPMWERELVAEIGSGWLAMELGCPPCFNMENYCRWVERWRVEMNQDDAFIFRAAAQARRAADLILSFIEKRGDDRYHDPDPVQLVADFSSYK